MNVRFDSTSVVVSAGSVSMPGSSQSCEISASAWYVGSERSGAAMMSSNCSAWAAVSAEIRWLTIRTIVTLGSSAATIRSRSSSKPPARLVSGRAAASVGAIWRSKITCATSNICRFSFSVATADASIVKVPTGTAGASNVPATSRWNVGALMVTATGVAGESATASATWAVNAPGPWTAATGSIATAVSTCDGSIEAACDATLAAW